MVKHYFDFILFIEFFFFFVLIVRFQASRDLQGLLLLFVGFEFGKVLFLLLRFAICLAAFLGGVQVA